MILIRKSLLMAALAVCAAQAARAETVAHQEFVCVRGTEQRVVSLYNQLSERYATGCRVEYTKSGRTQTLWSSQSVRGYCTGKLTQLVTRLAQDNFRCTPRTVESSEEPAPQR